MKTSPIHYAVSACGILLVGFCFSLPAFADGCPEPSFNGARVYQMRDFPGSAVAADFNGDGKLDLAVPDSGVVSVLLGNGDGTFQRGLSAQVSIQTGMLAAADVNGDGHADMLATYLSSGTGLLVALGDGTGLFGPATDHPLTRTAGDRSARGARSACRAPLASRRLVAYRIGIAYWRPPSIQSAFSPRSRPSPASPIS